MLRQAGSTDTNWLFLAACFCDPDLRLWQFNTCLATWTPSDAAGSATACDYMSRWNTVSRHPCGHENGYWHR